MTTTRTVAADDIRAGMRIITPGRTRPVLVIDHWDEGPMIAIAGAGGVARLVSRYATVEVVEI